MSSLARFDNLEQAESLDASLLTAALEACTDGLAIVAQGRLLYANRAFVRLVHKSDRRQIQGRALSEVLPDHDFAASQLTGNSESSQRASQLNVQKDESRAGKGTVSGVDIRCANFRSAGADFQIISLHDITEQRRIERKLQETQCIGALGRLVGGVAHDFNNLLTAIMLYSDLLAAGLTRERRLRHHAQEIRMAGEHGAALVRQLMAVAKPHAVELHTSSLNEIISGMKGMLTRLIGENIELTILLAEDLGAVRTDPAQMRQIILNLVLNARDAMPEGGQVRLETRNSRVPLSTGDEAERLMACVELSVSDTGCGMDAQTRSRLFEPFFTTKRPGRGSGLGLATADSIVKQGGGAIQVESEVGKGTRITVLLPRADPSLPLEPNIGMR